MRHRRWNGFGAANYIANLNTSGSIALNITKASAYLKAQRKQLEARFVPEAAKSYTAALSDIRRIEQEISALNMPTT